MARTEKSDEALIVVAKKQGYYGDKTRYVGERFVITSRKHFADVWMLEAGKPADAEEVAALERAFAERFPSRKRDISDEKLLAEVVQTSGVIAAVRAENLKLKDEIASLKRENHALKATIAGLEAGGATEAGEEPTAEGAGSDAGDAVESEDTVGGAGAYEGDAAGDDEPRPEERRRRRPSERP